MLTKKIVKNHTTQFMVFQTIQMHKYNIPQQLIVVSSQRAQCLQQIKQTVTQLDSETAGSQDNSRNHEETRRHKQKKVDAYSLHVLL